MISSSQKDEQTPCLITDEVKHHKAMGGEDILFCGLWECTNQLEDVLTILTSPCAGSPLCPQLSFKNSLVTCLNVYYPIVLTSAVMNCLKRDKTKLSSLQFAYEPNWSLKNVICTLHRFDFTWTEGKVYTLGGKRKENLLGSMGWESSLRM